MITDGVAIYKQSFGRGDWLIGLEGNDKEAITRRFWSFWNWKATSGKLDWWTDKFAVFWTDEARFKQAVLEICRTQTLRDVDPDLLKGRKNGGDVFAYDLREKFMANIKDEVFYTQKMRSIDLDTHAQLQISAENLTDWDAVKA